MNDGTKISPGKLTVIVGPNNSGKSRTLKEILQKTTQADVFKSVIVSKVEVDFPPSLSALRASYDVERFQDESGYWRAEGLKPTLDGSTTTPPIRNVAWPEYFEDSFKNCTADDGRQFAVQYGSNMVAHLSTESRLSIVKEGPSSNKREQVTSLLQQLYKAGRYSTDLICKELESTFELALYLDFTTLQRLLLRVGEDFSSVPPDPRDALPLMDQYEKLDDQGDGLRSFVAICVALLTLKRGLFLIDEPEAFLHPPQAQKVGRFIADQANQTRQIIIATHSVDVVRGILDRTKDVQIIRIDRVGNTNSFCSLSPERLEKIIGDPLLASARVLDGLFYSGAVVVEADSDARFYHAASLRMDRKFDAHFVNADNKQTVSRIVRLYQEMGIRSAGIVDVDVLNDHTEFEAALKELDVEPNVIQELLNRQRKIAQTIKAPSAEVRFQEVREKLTAITSEMDATQNATYGTTDESLKKRDKLLRTLENRFRELADVNKPWREIKKHGRTAIAPEVHSEFDAICQT